MRITKKMQKGVEEMTPLHLDILRHYYVTGKEYEQIPSNETRTDYAYDLAKEGLLFTPKIDGKPQPLFMITTFGQKVFKRCLLTLERFTKANIEQRNE